MTYNLAAIADAVEMSVDVRWGPGIPYQGAQQITEITWTVNTTIGLLKVGHAVEDVRKYSEDYLFVFDPTDGNRISLPLAERLLTAGDRVSVVNRDWQREASVIALDETNVPPGWAWIIFDDGHHITEGDSGSAVVDPLSGELYGMAYWTGNMILLNSRIRL